MLLSPASGLSVGARIKLLREKKGIGQAELAQQIGVSAPMLSLWENDRRALDNIDLIRKFALALNVSTTWMIDESTAQNSGFAQYSGLPVLKTVTAINIDEFISKPIEDQESYWDLDVPDRFSFKDSAYFLNNHLLFHAYKHPLTALNKFFGRPENIVLSYPDWILPDFGDDLIFGYEMPSDFLSDGPLPHLNILRKDLVFFSILKKVYPGHLCIVGLKSGDNLIGRFNFPQHSNSFFIESLKTKPFRIQVGIDDYDFVFRIVYSQPAGQLH